MHNDIVIGSLGAFGLIDHLLERRPIVVERRRARLVEDIDDFPAFGLAVGAALGDLIRQRQIAFSLPGG
jgi:hypothetical protein